MSLLTTTIGAYPKPPYIPIPDWFQQENTTTEDPTRALDECNYSMDPELEKLLDRGTLEVVREQVELSVLIYLRMERFAGRTISTITAAI